MNDREMRLSGAIDLCARPSIDHRGPPRRLSSPHRVRRCQGAYGLVAATFGLLGLAMAGAFPAQAEELAWATRAGSTGFDQSQGIATDGDGNSYLTGAFRGTATFGAGEVNETMLTAAGDADIFVAKYDAAGALLWATSAGSTGDDQGLGIATDGAGNSYLTGYFYGTATFGAGETGETTLDATGAGDIDIFVAKYDASGTLQWARSVSGTTTFDEGIGIATDGAGNSYVTGRFRDTATFGAGEVNETALTSAGFGDIFVAKYDGAGTLLWAASAGGTSSDNGQGIATDGDGNSYVTGTFNGTATFGVGEAKEIKITGAGNDDIFVAKYDAAGALLWATQAGGNGLDSGRGIATAGTGNSYVTGRFNGIATFGAGEVNETALTSAGSGDIFVAKYDAAGALLWAARAGGTSYDAGQDIAADGAGNSYLTGPFNGTATFGTGEVGETELTSTGSQDVFVAKYDAAGALLWATHAGGGGADIGQGIATDGFGNGYVIGSFQGTATFGAGEANETTLATAGSDDIFVAKLSDPIDTDGDGVADAEDQCLDTAPGIVVDADGCSISQLCPCDDAWKSHGEYLSCTAKTARDFGSLGLIGLRQKYRIIFGAVLSQCGRKSKG